MRGLHDYFRAVQYLIYSMFERIRGLDFSLRDNSEMIGERHGYAIEYELYRQVIDVLFSQCSGAVKERHIICYGDGDLSSIEKYEQACLIYEEICPHRKNRLVILKISCDRHA